MNRNTIQTAAIGGFVGIALGLFGAAAPANALLIDDFNTPNPTTNASSAQCPSPDAGTGANSNSASQCTFVTSPGTRQDTTFNGLTTDIIGGTRNMATVSIANGATILGGGTYSAPSPANLFAQVSQSTGGQGVFTHDQPAGLAGYSIVRWGFSATDFTAGGAIEFRLGLVTADHDVGWGIALKDNLGNVRSFYFPNTSPAPPPATLDVLFSHFAGVDLTHIVAMDFVANYAPITQSTCTGAPATAIESTGDVAANELGGTLGSATFCSQTAFDTQVNFIQTQVPEPATLALLGSALLGFGVVHRRRRRNA